MYQSLRHPQLDEYAFWQDAIAIVPERGKDAVLSG
jgi:hypothetical protein